MSALARQLTLLTLFCAVLGGPRDGIDGECSSHHFQPGPLAKRAEIGPPGRIGRIKTAPNAIFPLFTDFALVITDFAPITGLRA